jgi:hypothetical protein
MSVTVADIHFGSFNIMKDAAWKKADVVAAGGAPVPRKLPQGGRRYLTAFLCLCVSTICYADRAWSSLAH